MNRILIEYEELAADGGVVVRGERARHVREVLGVVQGGRIKVGVVDGVAGSGVIRHVDGASVAFDFEAEGGSPVRPRLDLLLAAPRPKVMKRLWAQLAALGVDRIIISNAWKVERCYFDSHALSPEKWRPRLIEGVQQAGVTRLPRVHVARRFKPLIEDDLDALTDADLRVVLHPGEPDLLITTPLLATAGRVLLAVGPEGGWTDYERDLLRVHRFWPIGLGMRILRTDTACIGALSIAAQRLEAGESHGAGGSG